MIQNAWKLSTMLVLAGLLWGCTAPPQRETPTTARVTVASDGDYDVLWDATGNVLREKFFQLDRQDRQAGIITTWPETSAAGFELWRPQSSDSYYRLEDNMHTIQRQVRVSMADTSDVNQYNLDVEIQRFRYRLKERQITNAAAAMRIYSSLAPTYAGEMESLEESSQWIPLGRDCLMEEELLAMIVSRYQEDNQPAAEPTADEDAQ